MLNDVLTGVRPPESVSGGRTRPTPHWLFADVPRTKPGENGRMEPAPKRDSPIGLLLAAHRAGTVVHLRSSPRRSRSRLGRSDQANDRQGVRWCVSHGRADRYQNRAAAIRGPTRSRRVFGGAMDFSGSTIDQMRDQRGYTSSSGAVPAALTKAGPFVYDWDRDRFGEWVEAAPKNAGIDVALDDRPAVLALGERLRLPGAVSASPTRSTQELNRRRDPPRADGAASPAPSRASG
jgi:hypothetical protein